MNTATTVANRFADARCSLLAHAAPNANSTDASNDPLASITADLTATSSYRQRMPTGRGKYWHGPVPCHHSRQQLRRPRRQPTRPRSPQRRHQLRRQYRQLRLRPISQSRLPTPSLTTPSPMPSPTTSSPTSPAAAPLISAHLKRHSATDAVTDVATDTATSHRHAVSHHSTIAPLAFCGSLRPPSVPSLNKGPMTSVGNLAGLLCAARALPDHRVLT